MTKFALTLAGFSASLFVLACSSETPEAETPVIRPAKLVTTEAASRTRDLNFPAVVRAARTSQLTFQVNGQIAEFLVLEGEEVSQGDVIARLDDRDYRNNLAQARAQFDNAEAEYQRARRLAEQDAISRSVLDGRRTQRDVARATLDSAEKNLSDTVLKAPFSGAVSRVYVEQFQNVQAKELVIDLLGEGVEAVVNVPSNIVARVPQFEQIGTFVVLDAAPEAKIPAEFKEAAGQADPSTQTYEVSFSFEAPEDLLILPGMTATVETSFSFTDETIFTPEGVAAPLSSVVVEGDEKFLWIVDPETMTVAKRFIQTGAGIGDSVVVTEGLEGGETIVAAGGAFLHEGAKIKPWQPR